MELKYPERIIPLSLNQREAIRWSDVIAVSVTDILLVVAFILIGAETVKKTAVLVLNPLSLQTAVVITQQHHPAVRYSKKQPKSSDYSQFCNNNNNTCMKNN